MHYSALSRRVAGALTLAGVLFLGLAAARGNAQGSGWTVRLPGHVPWRGWIAAGTGAGGPQEPGSPALTLPLPHPDQLQDLLGPLYDPADPPYRPYVSSR